MRHIDWPERLDSVLKESAQAEFSDTYYCATFAADCVEAITGKDPMAGFRGLSRDAAEKKVKAEHKSLIRYLVGVFGRPLHPSRASRGDVVIRRNKDGDALGICVGQWSAFLSDEGLAFEPTLASKRCFKVQ